MDSKLKSEMDLDKLLAEINKKRQHSKQTSPQITTKESQNLNSSKKIIQNTIHEIKEIDKEKQKTQLYKLPCEENMNINPIDESTVPKFEVNIDFDNEIIDMDNQLFDNNSNQDNNHIKNFLKYDKRIKIATSTFEEVEELDEDYYTSKDNKNILNNTEIFKILKKNKKFLISKTLILIFCFVLSILSHILNINNYIEGVNTSAVISLLALSTSILSCSTIIIEGLSSLFNSKCSFKSLGAICCIFSIIQTSFSCFVKEPEFYNMIYVPSTIMILLFSIFSKYLQNSHMKINSRFLMSEDKKFEIIYSKEDNIINPNLKDISCSYKCKLAFELCYNKLKNESYSTRILVYFLILLSFTISAVCFIQTNNIYFSLTALTCIIIACCPLSTDFCFNFIIHRLVKKMSKNKSILYKYSVLNKIKDCNNLLFNSSDLFNQNSFKLIKIKILDYNQINTSIINIASILVNSNSLLSKVFMDILNQRSDLLKDISSIRKDNDLGFSAIIDDKEVIFGTRDYLLDNNIVIPSKYINLPDEIESDKSLKNLFVSIGGILTAMFLIKITPVDEVSNMLKLLYKNEIKITLRSVDPILTSENISYIYNFNIDNISILQSNKEPLMTSNNLGVLYANPIVNFIKSIISLKKFKSASNICFFIQLIGILISCCLIIALIWLNSINLITYQNLLLTQFFWLLITWLISSIHRF